MNDKIISNVIRLLVRGKLAASARLGLALIRGAQFVRERKSQIANGLVVIAAMISVCGALIIIFWLSWRLINS
jgi:hypothetical protein